MAEYAQFLGYGLMYGGGFLLLVTILYYAIGFVGNLPLFKPKVLLILKLGGQEYLKRKRQGLLPKGE